jgi:hypothetical protein
MYDIIGDIHGHADELEELLHKMGYTKHDGVYSHPSRKVVFLGDFIDRGPKIRETINIVRAMIDAGNALAVIGNHEFNFLCYKHQLNDGTWLREHSRENYEQVKETISAFDGRPEEFTSMLEWFYSLPIFLELDDFRVVHACWQSEVVNRLKDKLVNNRITPKMLVELGTKGTDLFNDIELVLKGMEVDIDEPYKDAEGQLRYNARSRWWLNPKGKSKAEYLFRVSSEEELSESLQKGWYYPAYEKPVFIGHYWMVGDPELEAPNVCCVDYSIGRKGKEREAKLVAYRWDGGPMHTSNMEFVE